ncbi:MAG: hypothetical protein RSD88_08815 [Anaerovoracaceae bacterium]
MNRKIMHLLISITLISALIFSTTITGVAATTSGEGKIKSKEEVIYIDLSSAGVPTSGYAVNILNVSKKGTVKDHGLFTSVENLTNTNKLSYDKDTVTTTADKGRFYYQGNLSQPLSPWNINISYKLNGKLIKISDLPGATGHLQIAISINKNMNVNPTFFKNYLVQTDVTLDTGTWKNIKSNGGTSSNGGANKIITFTTMPGKEEVLKVSGQVTNLHLVPITLSGVPFTSNMDMKQLDKMTKGLSSLSGAVSQLSKGTNELSAGSGKLSFGADKLANGSASYREGLSQLSSNSSNLKSGSLEMLDGLKKMKKSLTSFDSGDIDKLSQGFSQGNKALKKAIDNIPNPSLSEADIGALMAANPGDPTVQALVANYQAAQTAKGTYNQVATAFTGVESALPSLTEAVTQLQAGITALTDNYSEFHSGLASYTGGVDDIAQNYASLNSGINNLSKGVNQLSAGAEKLAKGTNTLDKEVSKIPDQIDKALKEFTGNGDFKPVSFLSAENKHVASVQFVMETEKIAKIEKKAQPEKSSTKDTFWTRLKSLFTK